MKLTIDVIFPRKRFGYRCQPNKIYRIEKYSDNENLWEYLCQIGMVKVQANYKVSTASLYKSNGKSQGIINTGPGLEEEHPEEKQVIENL